MFPFDAYLAEKVASERAEAWRKEAENDRYAAQLAANTESRRPITYCTLALLTKPLLWWGSRRRTCAYTTAGAR